LLASVSFGHSLRSYNNNNKINGTYFTASDFIIIIIMGNHQSSSVDLSCIVEKLSHAPGERIQGRVVLKVSAGSQPLSQFDGITVTLAGAEIVVIDNSRLPGSRRIKLKQNVSKFDNEGLPEGVHEFPFELELPQYDDEDEEDDEEMLPEWTESSRSSSSSSSTSSSTISKQIVYKLRASLRRKKNVPLTSDTDYWCDAKCENAGEIQQLR
jgi:hypothetical protein